MKILANRESLLEAMSAVWSIVPTRSPKPILQNIKISATDDGTSVIATDLEVGITRRVSGVKVDRPGSAILSARVLAIFRETRDAEIAIEVDGGTLRLRGLSASFQLTSEDPDLYPVPAEFTATDYHRVNAADFRVGIQRTLFAIDEESTRFALGGVLWELRADRMTLAATDGRRLAEYSLQAETEGAPFEFVNGAEIPAPIVPGKACKLLLKALGDDATAEIAVNAKNSVLIRTEDAVIYSRIVEGRFPRYQDIFPGRHNYRIAMPAAALLGGLSQAAITTSEESRGVDLTFGPGALTLKGVAADVGDATIEIPIESEGTGFTITFDPRYLTGMLRVLPDDAEIRVDLIDAKNVVVFNFDDNYKYVAMPLTRDR